MILGQKPIRQIKNISAKQTNGIEIGRTASDVDALFKRVKFSK